MLNKKALSATAGAPKVFVEDVFSCFLYTGNGSTQTITNNIDLSGEGGLVWCKFRNDSVQHALYDTVRGVQKELNSAGTGAEITRTNGLTSFSSTGFVLGSDSVVNQGSAPNNYVSWTFRKAEKFFDVVTYTGNGSNRTISHSLGSTPGCIIVKRTDTTGDWYVYHRSNTANPETDYLLLNSTAATADLDTVWNDTAPTSTVFSVGTNSGVNANTGTYVAYLFAHDAGGFGGAGSDSIIKCGSYSGTGTTNFISLGWEPQWVLVKRSDSTGDWHLLDNMRGWVTDSSVNAVLFANTSGDEGQSASGGWPAATGFYAGSGAYTSSTNTNGGTYIYIAIRRGPMKTPTSGTSVYKAITRTGTGAAATVTGVGFASDLLLSLERNAAAGTNGTIYDRLRGLYALEGTVNTQAEKTATDGVVGWDSMDGIRLGTDATRSNINYSSSNYAYQFFKRAPGFFDVVCYAGASGDNRSISHNLGVAPELIIAKNRTNAWNWAVYCKYLSNNGVDRYLFLNTTDSVQTGNIWSDTLSPTATTFPVSANVYVSQSGANHVAYLFASVTGVSKVGSYTGTGSTQTINCGFTAGSRFVMVKRTDSTGDWYVWDSARGIVSGNDPYLLLNSTAAEVTNTDYIDTANSGFEISSTAPAAINANGGTFIFFAVA